MSPKMRWSFFVAIAAATLLVSAFSSARADGPMASGHGNLTVSGELRTFSFNAVKHADGSVTGESELKSRASGTVIHAALNCLTVVGNQAYIGGVVTNSNNSSLVGKPCVFTVIDNGEGDNAPPDELSFFVTFATGPTEDCNGPTVHSLTLNLIEAGDIQVKP